MRTQSPPDRACFGAAYEFLFNVRYQLAKHKLQEKASLTYLTAEPFAAHFGIGGFGNAQKMCEWMFSHYHIGTHLNASIKEVKADGVLLESGEFYPSHFTMVMPRLFGRRCGQEYARTRQRQLIPRGG